MSTFSDFIGGGGTVDHQEFTTSGTWTKPAGVNFVYVEAIGGGGGAKSSAFSSQNCQGGSGGEFSYRILPAGSLGSTEAVTVGAGGAGGAAGGFDGAVGGASSFGSHVIARGGARGGQANSQTAHPGQVGSLSPFVGGMVFPHAGYGGAPNGPGGPTIYGGGGGAGCTSVNRVGGPSVYGGNGGNASAAGAGQDGAAPGGGGGANGSATFKAGDGGAGRVRVSAW